MKVTIITGSSDGIGAQIARQLAREQGQGGALVLAARNKEMLDAVAGECAALGAQVLVVPTDVSDQAQCRHLIAATVERFGRIDALINNAGRSAHAFFAEVPDLAWYEELMRINFWGSVWCTHAALPHLKATNGSIVAVSSLAGLMGVPGRTAYSATKFAMGGFFEALRTELKGEGTNVSVTVAYPGVVATQIRHHGFNAEGKALGRSSLKEEGAMTVEECAALIVRGMQARSREVVMTAKGKLGRFMKLVFPGMVERLTIAAVAVEEKPH
jgi:short-subunit dehydrogenase